MGTSKSMPVREEVAEISIRQCTPPAFGGGFFLPVSQRRGGQRSEVTGHSYFFSVVCRLWFLMVRKSFDTKAPFRQH